MNLPFNWFDILVVIVLMLGIRSGRKRGMSEEFIGMVTWVLIATGCAFLYLPAGNALSQASVFSLLASYLMAYVGLAIVILSVSLGIKRAVGGKLIGSDMFGASEFYLGMIGGLVRVTCILISAIALLNARYYNPMEIKANLAYQNEVYGSNFFPTLYDVQAQVFEKSLSGPWIRNRMSFLLIKPTAPEDKQITRKEFAEP